MRNRAKCLKCGDVIESTYTHDFQWCRCHTIFVDGGTEYQRAGGDFTFFERVDGDTSEEEVAISDG